jgi:hypothetical protein
MTFQAYIDNIKANTGKSPKDFHRDAKQDGLLSPDLKATRFVEWMNTRYGVGRGHAMAIWAVFKAKGWVEAPAKSKK